MPFFILLGLVSLLIASCGGGGGGGGGSESNTNTGGTGGDDTQTGTLTFPYKNTPIALTNIDYRTNTSQANSKTGSKGEFVYKPGQTVTFNIAGKNYTSVAKASITTSDLTKGNSSTANHLARLLLNFDNDNDTSNGIQLNVTAASIDPELPENVFNKQVYKTLGRLPKPLFSPSLGINTEAPQGEADTVGQPMPFADLFRTARPFAELSGEVKLDSNGWPTEVDPSLNFARTKLLQGTIKDALPSGKYTLLYEGQGTVQLSGPISNITPLIPDNNTQGFTFDMDLTEGQSPESNALNVVIRDITPESYVQNIRIIMPGGTCKETSSSLFNPFVRVDSQQDCPTNTTYVSFAERLASNRNEIIFNPDYVSFLKDFKVIRMMNLMEASPGRAFCTDSNGIIDFKCVQEPTLWSARATLNDAVWGGSSRTDHRQHKGIPVEVLIELANQTHADPWFNIPHAADDLFVSKFAETVFNGLNPERKVYIEYSNEIWNSGFLGFHYMEAKGLEQGLGDNTPDIFNGTSRDKNYFARLRFYSLRSVEIFDIWEGRFGGSTQLVRVLGTSQGDKVLSENILEYNNAAQNNKVDALAMAPYFFGCIDRTGSCSNAPKVLAEITSINDVFDIIDQPFPTDPLALEATLEKISIQANVANDHGVDLIAYEGGQHLTILGSLGDLPSNEKQRLRDLFKGANRDPRMKERYTRLLTGWKAQEGRRAALFTLYTLPQTYYQFGNWGIKEHLNKPRSDSPKYDAAMLFQERVGECWWGVGC